MTARWWIGGSLLACACAVPSPPPAPPRPPPEPPPAAEPAPPDPPPWQPRVDPRDQAELDRLEECSAHHVARFQDSEPPEPRELLAALGCFEEAGRSAHAIQVIRHLRREFPELEDGEDLAFRERQHYRVLADERLGADTLVGRACGASVFDPPLHASVEALRSVAECLEEAAMVGAALRYWRLALERGGSDEGHVERLETTLRRVEQKILEL